MAFFIGLAVLVVLLAGLAWAGNRTRRDNPEPWKLSRSRNGGQAERNATGATVTRNIENQGPGSF